MPQQKIDYDALARQHGAIQEKPPAAVDYDALAKQYGAVDAAPEAKRPIGASGSWEAQSPPLAPSFLQSLPAMGGGMALGAKGAAIGGAMGGPVGAALGGLAGAGLGAFGGELLRQGTESAFRGDTRALDVSRAAGEATSGMMGEATGQVLGRAIVPISAKLAPFKMTPTDRAAVASARTRGVPLTTTERSRSPLAASMETGVGRTIFGRTPIQRVAERQSNDVLKNWWEPEILDQIAPYMDESDVGVAVMDALGESKQKLMGNISRMFDRASELAGNVTIPDAEIRTAATRFLNAPELVEALKRAPSLADSAALKTVRELSSGLPSTVNTSVGFNAMGQGPVTIQQVIPGAQTMPFKTAEILRKQIETVVREASTINPAVGRLKYLSGVVERTMRDALMDQSPEAFRIWDAARQLYGPAKRDLGSLGKQFQDTKAAAVLQRLGRSHPEEVVQQLMKSGLSGIETAKKYLEFSPVWKNVQRAVLEDTMEKALTTESSRVGPGMVRGQHWQTMFNKELPKLKRILTADTMEGIEEFNSVVRRVRLANQMAGNASETGSALTAQGDINTLIHVAQAGLAIPTAGISLLGPHMIAKLLTSEGGARLLTEGLRVRTGTEAAERIAGQIAARLMVAPGQN